MNEQSTQAAELPLAGAHRVLGARFQQLHGRAVPADYGDPAREYAHLRDAAAAVDLSWRSRLRVAGSDRQEFLQGMLSNDVALAPGAGTYACYLDARGHLIADVRVYARPDYYLLELAPQAGEPVRERLDFYVIASDVAVTDASAEYAVIALSGPRARQAVGRVCGDPGDLAPFAQWESPSGVLVVRAGPLGGPDADGYELWLPPAAAAACWQDAVSEAVAAGGGPAGVAALEALRVERGIPLLGADLDASTIPQEAGLELTAVSWTKGCYVGQETVARLDSRGNNVARRLRGLLLPGDTLPSPGDKIFAGDAEVGQVTSAARSPALGHPVALAYVRRGHNETGTALLVRTAGGDVPATVTELPFTPLG